MLLAASGKERPQTVTVTVSITRTVSGNREWQGEVDAARFSRPQVDHAMARRLDSAELSTVDVAVFGRGRSALSERGRPRATVVVKPLTSSMYGNTIITPIETSIITHSQYDTYLLLLSCQGCGKAVQPGLTRRAVNQKGSFLLPTS